MFKNRFFIIGLLLTLSLLWPLIVAPFFTHHDDVQTIRLYEMDKCIKDLQIPCRWVPDLGDLYGYPLFNYYAPLAYYYGEVIYLITSNLIFSVKIMFATAFVGSFIFMYLLGRKIWGDKGGSLAAVFYSFIPYHAVNFYVRGAMGEMWALMFFPAIFWALWRLKESPRVMNLMLTAFFMALLTLSHNISAMLFLPITCVMLVIFYFQKKDSRYLKFALFSILLGLLLSAFYWLPMMAEKNSVHVDTTTVGYFSYTEHFKGLRKLLVDRFWGWGGSVREVPGGERDGLSYQIGWVHLLGWILALITAKRLWRKNRNLSLFILFSSLVISLSIFMIHPRSKFVWGLIEPLKYLQFPWRFLTLISFFISLLSGSIFLWWDKKRQSLLWTGLVVLVVLLNFSYFRPEKFLQINDAQLLSGENWTRQLHRSIFDFLPAGAPEPPAKAATARYQIITGETEITNFRERTTWIAFDANTTTHSIVRLSQYYFPNWRLKVDGQNTPMDYKNSLGLMTFILGKGNHQVELRLIDTPVRTFSNWLTIIGAVISMILILTQIPKSRKWIFYYLHSFNR